MPHYHGDSHRALRLLLCTLILINLFNMVASTNIIGTLTEGVEFLDEMISFIEKTSESVISYGFSQSHLTREYLQNPRGYHKLHWCKGYFINRQSYNKVRSPNYVVDYF